MKVGDLVEIHVFKEIPEFKDEAKKALVLKVDADLVKVVFTKGSITDMITWIHKNHTKVISHGK